MIISGVIVFKLFNSISVSTPRSRSIWTNLTKISAVHPASSTARERLRIAKEIPKAKLGVDSTEGDAPGKPQFIGQIDPKDIDTAIEYYNEQIRNGDIERAFVIDRNGNVYYSEGDRTSVSFDGIDLKGATITHNHPESEGIISFGKNDFEFLREYQGIRELQCVNAEYNYRISVIKDITEVVYNDIYLAGFKYAFDPDYESQDAAMRVLCEKGYVKYERIKFAPG